VFTPPAEVIDPTDHPFAALKALRNGDTPAPVKKDPKKPGGDNSR
jgi:hypothetical protein